MSSSRQTPGHPPAAPEHPFEHKAHGQVRQDPWHWLRERDNPEVLAHLEAENAYTETRMAALEQTVDGLYHELIGRIEETSQSAPYPEGQYIYQSRIDKGQDYRSYYRKATGDENPWTLYFDGNAEAADHAYFDIGFLDVSPDGRILAYALDFVGEESYILRFRDLKSGRDLPIEIPEVSGDGEWDASGQYFYFMLEDQTRRPDRICRYRLGTDPDTAECIYTETDPKYFAGIYKSQDEKFIFAVSESKETTEIHYLSSGDETGSFKCLLPRRTNIQYWMEHHEGNWLVRTNEEAPDFKLLKLPLSNPSLADAEEVLPARDSVRLEDILVLKQHWLFFERTDGLDRIRVRNLQTGQEHTIAMEDPVYDVHPGANEVYETNHFRYVCSSPIRPAKTISYNLDSREKEELRTAVVPSGHNPEDYTVYRMNAISHDGTEVPLTVFHRKDLAMDGTNPAYLYGYGAYGITVEASFRTSWLTWLERGYVVAIAHVRGGGLLGEEWYQNGKFTHKPNTFRDFVACAETLIENNYTRPRQIVTEGGSAGGLLMGAVLNLRPDLFRAAVATVPFVDVVSTMLDASLPLTTFEYEEWGNPNEQAVFETMMAYSPYDNVQPARYPALFVTAGYNDPRVAYWEAAKWVARLRKSQKGKTPILLRTNLDTGHGGASGRYESWRETAMEQAFLLQDWEATAGKD